jgi:NitT/TauT family transport system permease protein
MYNSDNIIRVILPLLGLFILLALWQLCVTVFEVPVIILPSPIQILDAATQYWQVLLEEGFITALESLGGFALGILTGVPLAIAITSSRPLNYTVYPLLIATQSLPKVALAPIVLVWMGTGMNSKIAIAWLVAFFPILVDTATGLRNTPEQYIVLARSARASRLQTFAKVQFPSALPFIFAGSKVAITLALIGAVIGEFVGSTEGLGSLLLVANSQLNTPLAFAALIALGVLGILLYGLVAAVEALARPWMGEAHH